MTIHRHGEVNYKGDIITPEMCEGCKKEKEENIIRFRTATFNNKKIAYTTQSLFLIQVGKNKSTYKTQYTIKGDLQQALIYYNGINLGNGYKKRLVNYSLNKPVLARQFS